MAGHRKWVLIGSAGEIAAWQWDNPDLASEPIPLHTPERLSNVLINPWDEIVYLESYYGSPSETRTEIWGLVEDARVRGRLVQP